LQDELIEESTEVQVLAELAAQEAATREEVLQLEAEIDRLFRPQLLIALQSVMEEFNSKK
jgi:hypothetical protein